MRKSAQVAIQALGLDVDSRMGSNKVEIDETTVIWIDARILLSQAKNCRIMS